ncbi:MAG: hypothetical protein QS721_10180 [Candidatus Endonucleobacter sp. (ex Gigantidas childressi)]|nr:hypothetical protein [Candidatus Endonucleobacter sp. (ex Gigantidas childressi)]
MILSHIILIRCIVITSTILLFPYNACAVHNKNRELTLPLSKIDSTTSHNASSSVEPRILTKNCNIDNWGGHHLSLLSRSLTRSDSENTRVAMLKVCRSIIKSGLSCWNADSTSTMFTSLTKLRNSYSKNTDDEKTYKIALQLIIDHLASTKVDFSNYSGKKVASLINGLLHMSELGWPNNVTKIRHNLAKLIIKSDISISPSTSNDWTTMICGLQGKYEIEKEAIKILANYFHIKDVHLSKWTKIELMSVLTAFSYQDGQHIELAIKKIGDYIVKTDLDYWEIIDLAQLAKVLCSSGIRIHSSAIEQIASHMLHKPRDLCTDSYINLVNSLSKSRDRNCLEFTQKVTSDVSDNTLDLSHYSYISLAKLVTALCRHNNKRIGKALHNIASFLLYNNPEQLLYLPPKHLKWILYRFGKQTKSKAVSGVIQHVSRALIKEDIHLSSWKIDTLEILLTTLNNSKQDDVLQQAFSKIVAELNRPKKELRKWSIPTLARVAKGVSNFRNYSSERLLARLAHVYLEKREENESTYGVNILSAICHLPIESSKIITVAVKLAAVLYKKSYANMTQEKKLSLFWGITILHFVVHEEWRKVDSNKKTKKKISKLKKIIPEINQHTTKRHTHVLNYWQEEFINIMNSNHRYKSNSIKLLKHNHTKKTVLKNHINKLIKKSVPYVDICTPCLIRGFPSDLLIQSGTKCVLVEIDGPQHFFKDKDNNTHRLAKDRFVDFVIEQQLRYKIIRINYEEARDDECKSKFIQKIIDALAVAPVSAGSFSRVQAN